MDDPLGLFDFLGRLERGRISFKLDRCREDAIMVEVAVPGERWEVEFFRNGEIEVEVFRSAGEVAGGDEARPALNRLLADTPTDR